MKPLAITLFALVIVCRNADAQSRFVTLKTEKLGPEPEPASHSVSIAQSETAELVSFPYDVTTYLNNTTSLRISNGTNRFEIRSDNVSYNRGFFQPIVVAGPAEISLMCYGGRAYATFKISPESFPPDKTIIIPEGTGARIALECIINLTQWTEVYSATHTNSPSNKFFRIKAERIP
jgi:hypothetical protein